MRVLLIVLLLLPAYGILAQPRHYTTANVHSHNDYEQRIPFWMAYNRGFGSIEADIFLVDGQLLVAHSEKELVYRRSLESYYLDELAQCVRKNGGYPYPDTTAQLQMLIDIKTDSIQTLAVLIKMLKKYPDLAGNPAIKFVISGRRPAALLFPTYPAFIWFDGVLSVQYGPAALKKIAMLSDNFKTYSQWTGDGRIPAADWSRLETAVNKAHALHKPVRFWNAPDSSNAWRQFMRLRVDYINTDCIDALSSFLNDIRQSAGQAE